MRNLSRYAFMLLAVSLIVASSARALPTNEVFDTYYDCSLNEVGWRLLSCGGHVYTSGQQGGAYRYRELTSCNDSGYSAQWYYWSGTNWIAISSPPGPNC